MRIVLALAVVALLGACKTTGAVVETRYKTITVTKRGPCPAEPVYARLKASRPTPLRNQARPRTGVERNARVQGQLGLYEGEGGWADQVSAALDRCQLPAEDTEESEGVASPD